MSALYTLVWYIFEHAQILIPALMLLLPSFTSTTLYIRCSGMSGWEALSL